MKSKKPDDLSFLSFLKHFVAEVFQIDSRISRTLLTLLKEPGMLTVKYFSPSKNNYIPPVRLYFIINFLFFLLIPVLSTPQFQVFSFNLKSLTAGNGTYQEIINNQINESNVSAEIYEERFNAHLKYNQPAMVFIIIPLFALTLKLVFANKKRFYLEHLFFSFHFLTFFLIGLLLAISLYRFSIFILKFFSVSAGSVAIVILLSLLVWFLYYLFTSLKRFNKESSLSTLLKFPFAFTGFVISLAIYVQFLFFYTFIALKWSY